MLIGAVAMGLHGVVRATEDVDLLLKPTADNVARLRSALGSVYPADPCIAGIRSEDLLGDYPVVRYGPDGSNLSFVILANLGDSEDFASIEAQTIEVQGIPVSVASPRALYRLKAGTLRPIDHRDAAALREQFDIPEKSRCLSSASFQSRR